MRPTTIVTVFIAFMIGFGSQASHAQTEVIPAPDARPSPVRLAATHVGDTFIKIVYGSPQKRDREIFGGLVPFDAVWRTGANETTEILFTGPVNIAGVDVDAGVYSVFTIPSADSWTLILNDTVGQWGAFSHDPETDAYRISAVSTTTDALHEAFTISFGAAPDGNESTTHLVMNWDQTEVRFPISAR